MPEKTASAGIEPAFSHSQALLLIHLAIAATHHTEAIAATHHTEAIAATHHTESYQVFKCKTTKHKEIESNLTQGLIFSPNLQQFFGSEGT